MSRIRIALGIASTLVIASCAPMRAPLAAGTTKQCSLGQADHAWLDASVAAWNMASSEITGIGQVQSITGIFFDASCVVESSTALNGGPRVWSGRLHNGTVQVPGGPSIPPGVISFAMGGEGRNFFVMSTPSVWRAAVRSDNGLGSLETLMTVVVLHEGTHVAQIPTYGKRIEALALREKLPEDFNDDSIQQRFRDTPEFAASIRREIELLLTAAEAPDRAEAVRLAREARQLMKARQERWYVGRDAYLNEAEDIWLSMEGSAQWGAYQWAIDPRGGRVPKAAAFHSFGRLNRWWSQDEGFAVFMALDRLSGGNWKRHAFGDGAKTGLQMLDEAIRH